MRKIFYLIALLALVVACSDPYEKEITPAYDNVPVATYLEKNPESFSKWVEVLNRTGLFSTLNLSANYTCFVPTNAAVDKYLQRKGYASVAAIPVDDAKYLVKYHTIKGKQYTQSLFDNGAMADSTATGDYLTIEIRSGGLNSIYVNGEARIAQLDITATNGTIHTLDDVLNPVTETLYQKLEAADFSLFKQAVELTGLQNMLNSIYITETNSTTGVTTQRKRFYTLFAVPNSVFASAGINNITDLVTTLGAQTNYTEPTNALYKYVAYHLLSTQLDYAALAEFGTTKSKNIATMATNELINLQEVSASLFINYNKTLAKGVKITTENINAKNGIMHIVDGLMEVKTPPITTVIWELTDYAEVASLFPNAYRKSTLASNFNTAIELGSVKSYNWSAMPTESNNFAVRYFVANKNDAVRYTFRNYDCLSLSLGLYGWIEMTSPAIVKGTYSMKIYYYSANSATKYGKVLTILDGKYIGAEVATHGSSTTTARITSTTLGNVTFSETTTHKLRLLAGDNNTVFIDYIEFVPVN